MIIRMHDVTVTRVVMRDSPDDEAPKEKVDLKFSAADVEVEERNSGGGTRD